jgi:hypothetical protein
LGGNLHGPGYHFAINSDIAMFRVYSSSVGKYALPKGDRPSGINRALFEATSPMTVQSTRSPVLAHVSSTASASILMAVFSSAANNDNSQLYAKRIVVDKTHYAISSSAQDEAVISFSDKVVSVLQLSSANNVVVKALPVTSLNALLLVTSSGNVALTDLEKGQTLLASQALNLGTVYDLQSLSSDACGADSSSVCFVILSSSASGIFTVSSAVLTSTSKTLKVIQSTTVAVNGVSVMASSAKLAIQNQQMILFATVNDAVIATVLSGKAMDKLTQTPWVSVTVGRNMDFSLNNDQVLMLTTDYGYCYNSHEHNTRAYPTICSTLASATQHTLDYSLGLFDDWVKVLSTSNCLFSSSSAKCFAVTSCSRDLFHGTYDLGSKPAVMMLPKVENDDGKSMFIEVHEGLNPSELYLGGCGEPLRRDGLVIDSFMIDEWVDALRTRNQL